MKIIFFSITLFFFQTISAQLIEKDSLNTNKLLLAGGLTTGTFIYAYGIQNNMWWKGEPSSFHSNWLQDWSYALGADKLGHFYFGNLVSTIYQGVFRWTGFTERNSFLYSGLFTLTYQTFLEIRDGFSNSMVFVGEILLQILLAQCIRTFNIIIQF